ncbi:MAG: type IV secretion system protein [Pseudomonadota bacterium]
MFKRYKPTPKMQDQPQSINEAPKRALQVSSDYENEVYLAAVSREKRAWRLSYIALGISACSVLALVIAMPLKTTEPYLLVVDSTTGYAERAVSVDKMQFDDDQAIVEANIFRYVIDRETYDTYDNQERIESTLQLSADTAESSFRDIWSPDNPNHPDEVYGEGVRILVSVKTITIVNVKDRIAQVRLGLVRKQRGLADVESAATATLKYDFDPSENNRVSDVWNNPHGFQVTEYRVSVQNGV